MTTHFASINRNIIRPLLLILLVYAGNGLFGQAVYTAIDKQIDSAVHHYNAFRDANDRLSAANISEAQILQVVTQANTIVAELDAILRNSSGQQYEVAQYFRTMTIYEQGFVYGMAGRLREGYATMKRIETYMSGQSAASFPKRYLYEGKNYVINWENFAPTQLEYFTSMAELAFAEKEYDNVIGYVKKAVAVTYTTTDESGQHYMKYVAYSKYMEACNARNIYPDDAMDAGIAYLEHYVSLTEEYKKTVADNKLPTQVTGYNYLILLTIARPELSTGWNWARAGYLMLQCNDNELAGTCFSKALDAGYGNPEFYTNVYANARATNNNALGLKTCAAEEKTISRGECGKWRSIAVNWRTFGNPTKAADAETNAMACEAEAAYQQKILEQEQKKIERKNNLDFSMYAGFYPIPLLTLDNDYRDYGGVIGLGVFNISIQGSYKHINRNLVVFDDLFYQQIDNPEERILWDGYRAHVALMFGERDKSGNNFFAGPLLEVTEKNMTPIKSTVLDEATSAYVADAVFQPTETAYNMYFNYGIRLEENHIMFEYFIGLGATYSTFNIGNENFSVEEHMFSNTLLEYRKEQRWGPIVRFGVTFGFTTRD